MVEDTGTEVSGLEAGDLMVASFLWQDNTCDSTARACRLAVMADAMAMISPSVRSMDLPDGQPDPEAVDVVADGAQGRVVAVLEPVHDAPRADSGDRT